MDAGSTYALSGGTLYTPTININNGTFTFASGTLATDASTPAVAIVLGENGIFAANPISNANSNYTYTGNGTLALTMNHRLDNTISGTFTDFAGTVAVNKGALSSARFDARSANVSDSLKNNSNVTIALTDGTQLMGGTFACDLNITGTGYIEAKTGGDYYFGVLRDVSCTGVVTLTGNATIGGDTTIGGTTTLSNTVTANGNYTLTLGGNYNPNDKINISGQIKDGTSGALTLTLQSSTTTLGNANNTYSGGTTISSGSTLNALSAGSLGSAGVTNNGTLTFNISENGSFAQTITGSGVLNKTGTGTLKLTGANTNTGNTTVSAGTLDLSQGVIYKNLGANRAVTIGGGADSPATLIIAGFGWNNAHSLGTLNYSQGNFVLNNGTLQTSINAATGRGITLNAGGGTFNVIEGTTLTLQNTGNNKIAGAGSLTKTGTGVLKIESNNNTYTGNTIVSAGTLDLSQGVIYNTGTTTGCRHTVTIGGGADSPATLIIGGFEWNNSHSLGQLNNNQGNFVLNNGTVQTSIDAKTKRAITLNAGGGTFNVVEGTTLTLENSGANKITGVGVLIKTGTGMLKITSTNNDYTGETRVKAGELIIDGSLLSSSALIVDYGAMLSGSGEIGCDVTINDGGYLSPGNSPGTITLKSGLNMSGIWNEEITSLDLFDKTVVTGAATFDDTSVLNVFLTGYTPAPGDTFDILTAATITGYDNWENLLSASSRYIWNLSLVDINGGGQALRLSVDANAVPEPSTWALLMLGVLGLLGLRRRR